MITNLMVCYGYTNEYLSSVDGSEHLLVDSYVESIEYELNNNRHVDYLFRFNGYNTITEFTIENARHYPIIEWYSAFLSNKPTYFIL